MNKITLLFSCLFIFSTGFSQIIYNTYNPNLYAGVEEIYEDTVAYVYCDINNDSIDDFRFRLRYFYSMPPSPSGPDEGFWCDVFTYNDQFQIAKHNEPCTVKPFLFGDTIWNNLSWDEFGSFSTILIHDPEWGFIDCTPFSSFKYLAINLNINNNVYYGWIKIRSYYYLSSPFESWAKFYLSESAFNLDPNCGIIAGDSLTSLQFTNTGSLYSSEDLIIYPNPAKNEFYIDLNKLPDIFETIEIYSINGNVIKSQILVGSEINKIDITSLDKGLYIVKLLSNDKVQIIKLVKN